MYHKDPLMASTANTLPKLISNRTVKSALLLLPIMAIALPSYGESFTAKRTGQGFTSLTHDFTSSLSNPALLTKFDDDDDVFFSLNLGVLLSDEYDVIDTTEDIGDNLNQLADDIDAIDYQDFQTIAEAEIYYDNLTEQVDNIITDFEKINDKTVKARNGINLQIIIPNNYLSFGLFTNQYGRYGAVMNYSETDENILNGAIDNCINPLSITACELDIDDLDSTTLAIGYSIIEAGIMAAYPLVNRMNYHLSVGTKLKYQRIDLYYNRVSANDFDDDNFDLTDDEYITDESDSNIDLGLYVAWGKERQWNAALVVNNLKEYSLTHANQDVTFILETSATLGFSYQNNWVSLATELDLTDREHFANFAPSKYAGVGAEFRVYEHLQFRLGYRTDLNDVDDDIYTAGIGISPWDVLAFDIAAFTGDNDTIGAALQLSLKI